MGVTTNFSFPYPALTDAPDGPSQIQALAEAVDAEIEDVLSGGTPSSPTLITTDTWHNVTTGFPSGWTLGDMCRYKLYPDNTVHVQFDFSVDAASGTYTLFTLPTHYKPATQYDGAAPRIFDTTGTFSGSLINTGMKVLTDGTVEIVVWPGTALNRCSGHWIIPLD